MNAAILAVMDKTKCAYTRTPTYDEVTELALLLAKEEGVTDPMRLSLIYRPTWVSPPEPALIIHMQWAKTMREKATNALTVRMNPQLYKKRTPKPPPKPATARTGTGTETGTGTGGKKQIPHTEASQRFPGWGIREGPETDSDGGPRRGVLRRRDPGNTLRNEETQTCSLTTE